MTASQRDLVASLGAMCEEALAQEAAVMADSVSCLDDAAWWAEFAEGCASQALAICEGRA